MNFQGFLALSTQVTVTVLMVDSSDHITGKTGLSAGLTIYASKAGATPAAITPTVAELDATNVKGVYSLVLTTTHTNTLGELQIHITATGADPTDIKWQVGTNLASESALQTGDSYARLGAPAGASIAADLAEIEGETDGIAAIPTNNGTNQTGDTYGLLTGVNTELVAVPASTATLVNMLKWLFLLSRNRLTQTSTTTLARNDADGATVGTSTISDDGTTFVRGKFS